MSVPKRLIEVDLPIKVISEHARRDQNIRKGHLHTMHVWWATRPLASCRAVLMAAMLPDPLDNRCPESFRKRARHILSKFTGRKLDSNEVLRNTLLRFVGDFAAWERAINPVFLEAARALVLAAHPEGSPLVVDPFAGAGSIPFEALRLGANALGADLNPIAVLLNQVALQNLPRYGSKLAEGVQQWGRWVLKEARERLSKYYPADSNGAIPISYLWARTIRCEGPGCGAEVPLLGLLWLSRKRNNLAALRYSDDRKNKRINIEVFRPRSERELQPPISKRFTVTCPICNYTTPYARVREQLRAKNGGTNDARPLATILLAQDGSRSFRTSSNSDIKAAEKATKDMERLEHENTGPVPLRPDEPYPDWYSGVFNPGLWNIKTYGDLFTGRQCLALNTFVNLVLEVYKKAGKKSDDVGLSDAIATCLALAVSNMSHYLSSVSIYALDHMISAFVQGSGVAMRPDFAEANPLIPKLVGGFDYALGQIVAVLERESRQISGVGTALQSTAASIPLPDGSVPYLVTDPPYYAAVPYADLSDFCYVWIKRMLRDVHPDLLNSKLTPKDDELIAYYVQPTDRPKKDAHFFEEKMEESLADCHRVLQPNGIALIIFAHKGTTGWEALLKALIAAGWTVTASWPIDTERAARMRAKNSAVLASSVHLVCRPRESLQDSEYTDDVGDWREVLQELPGKIHEWMPRLVNDGVVGADAIFACLGPALEIFSRYSSVEKANGEKVTLKEYLEHVWAVVAREALNMIFEGADATGFEEDSRLTAMWLWTLSTAGNRNGRTNREQETQASTGYILEYDAARKIAQGLGAHMERLTSLVEIKGETARLLPVSERTSYLFGKGSAQTTKGKLKKKDKQLKLGFIAELEQAEEQGAFDEALTLSEGKTILDHLHQSMILFAAGRSEALKRFLVEEGIGRHQRFWRLAQALSALYPPDVDEKRWVDGVLARKKGLGF